MLEALALAARGRGNVEPNPMVGALITSGARVLGKGYHRRFGGPHAEVEAIADAGRKGHNIRGAELYVTLEPCAHRGKTPPCSHAVLEAGIRKVCIAARDPMAQVHSAGMPGARSGTEVLRAAGLEIGIGVCRDAALMLNAAFYKRAALGLPLVTAKWAMSADGRIAAADGSSRWISCPDSRAMVHRLRGEVDAIIIGAGTAKCDNPYLTCRETEKHRTPLRVVLCGRNAPAPASNLLQTLDEAPLAIAYPESQPPRGIKKLQAAGAGLMPLPRTENQAAIQVDPLAVLNALARRGASNVLIEGGCEVLGSFFDACLIDRALIFLAPFIIGGAGAVSPVGGKGVQSIKSALALQGPLSVAENDSAYLPDKPCTEVRVMGKDLMISGWMKDPRQWYDTAPTIHPPTVNGVD